LQPVKALQASVVQGLLSLQTRAVPLQAPVAQVSVDVQALPSSQAAALFVNEQLPVAELQLSVVHGLLSLQTLPPPA
jgi:hypothetical protein